MRDSGAVRRDIAAVEEVARGVFWERVGARVEGGALDVGLRATGCRWPAIIAGEGETQPVPAGGVGGGGGRYCCLLCPALRWAGPGGVAEEVPLGVRVERALRILRSP